MQPTEKTYAYTNPRLCLLLAEKPTKLSLAMHSKAFRALGLDYTYATVDSLDTEAAVAAVRALGVRGLSVTIPHKEKICALLDELSTEVRAIGAANTVVNEEGKLIGYNTDCWGITETLKASEYNPRDKTCLIYGNGGAARAACYALKEMGATLSITGRNFEKSAAIARDFSIEALPWAECKQQSPFSLLINASPLGSHLAEDSEGVLSELVSLAREAVFDMVTRDTPLLKSAREKRLLTLVGLDMLLYQALRQFELFTGEKAPKEVMEAALKPFCQ